jgi:hypothetical protein
VSDAKRIIDSSYIGGIFLLRISSAHKLFDRLPWDERPGISR